MAKFLLQLRGRKGAELGANPAAHLEGCFRTEVQGEQTTPMICAFPNKVQVKTGDLFASTFNKPLSCANQSKFRMKLLISR